MSYRVVFFDAGETLVYPHPSFPELLAQILREEGFRVDPAAVREKLYVVNERFDRARQDGELWSTSPERSRIFWASIYERLLGELGVPFGEGITARLYTTFTHLSNYRLFPDVLRTLERLRRQALTLGLISNFEEWLERLLESLDVRHYFDVRLISGVEGMEKPDRRIFRLALDRAGIDPQDALYVGDSLVFDVEPAMAAGMGAVLLDRRGRYPEYEGLRITSLEDLPAAIGLAA